MPPAGSRSAPKLTARLQKKGFSPFAYNPRFFNRAGESQRAEVNQTRRDARFCLVSFVLPSVELEEQSCYSARVNLGPSFLIERRVLCDHAFKREVLLNILTESTWTNLNILNPFRHLGDRVAYISRDSVAHDLGY